MSLDLPLILGLFNACNKVLVGLDILLEWREYFKDGVPLTNIIRRKLMSLKLKTPEVNLNTAKVNGELLLAQKGWNLFSIPYHLIKFDNVTERLMEFGPFFNFLIVSMRVSTHHLLQNITASSFQCSFHAT